MLLLVGFFALSCSDDSTTTRDYFTGSITLEFPAYVNPGYSKTFDIDTLMTLTRDDEGTIGYYFTEPVTGNYDTLVTADGVIQEQYYTYTVYDTLASLTLTLTAFAESDYYSSSGSTTFTVVKPGLDGTGSITNFSITAEDNTFTDDRDGNVYYYTTVENTDWMRQNLAWEGAGRPYEDCSAMSYIFGHYYTWNEAQTACPDGWRLPSDDDWAVLAENFGTTWQAGDHFMDLSGDLREDLYFNGTKMWEYWRDVNVTNAAGLSVMPVGYLWLEDGEPSFEAIYEYAAFWTSTEYDNERGVLRYMYEDVDVVYFGAVSKSEFGASVRCVRDN